MKIGEEASDANGSQWRFSRKLKQLETARGSTLNRLKRV